MTDDEMREAAGAMLETARGPRSRRSLARIVGVSEATLRHYETGWREVHIDGETLRTAARIPEVRIPALAMAYGVAEADLRDALGLPEHPVAVDVAPDITVIDKGPGVGTGMNRLIVQREGLKVESTYADPADRAQLLIDIFGAMDRVHERGESEE